MKGKTIYLSPLMRSTDDIREMLSQLDYIVINDKELIKWDRTTAIIEELKSESLIESSPLLNRYNTPIIYIDFSETKLTKNITDSNIFLLKYSSDREVMINRLDIYLKNLLLTSKCKNQSRWLKGILNNSTEGIIGIDDEGNIEFINGFAQNIIGIEDSKAVCRNYSEVLKFKDLAKDRLFNGREVECEVYNWIAKEYNPVSAIGNLIINSFKKEAGRIIIFKSIGEMKKLFDKVKYQASHDNLTGLLNRQSFLDSVDEHITYSKIDKNEHGLIVISIDKFKIVNDTCGHLAGDELLRKISYILRESDPDNKLIKSRVGGDEFGILISDSNQNELKRITKSLQRKITSKDFIWGEKEFPISCSFGLTTITPDSENHHVLIAALDDACAIAKEKGGNKIEIYNGSSDNYNNRRDQMLWIHRLKDAISKDRFELYYQEIKSLGSSDIKRVEILLRLRGIDGELINPNDFIPPAERYGLMAEIDKIVIEKSIAFHKKLLSHKEIKERFIFSVNISATSIPDKSFPKYIQNLFQKYRVPPTLFSFEITETATISNMDLAMNLIKSLKRIGCTFSLDDFGSGFSNFSYLKNLEIDNLKIDGSLIHNINSAPVNRAIVESINNIGHAMKLKTIAEFVKDKKVRKTVEEIGVDFIQGYEIGMPTPIEDLLNSY